MILELPPASRESACLGRLETFAVGALPQDAAEEHTRKMGRENSPENDTDSGTDVKHRVQLPRFIVREPMGAGQVVKRMTRAVGMKPCAPCEQRAARMDRWLRIEPRGLHIHSSLRGGHCGQEGNTC